MYHVAPNTYFYLCMQMDGGGFHQMWFTVLHHCHHADPPRLKGKGCVDGDAYDKSKKFNSFSILMMR